MRENVKGDGGRWTRQIRTLDRKRRLAEGGCGWELRAWRLSLAGYAMAMKSIPISVTPATEDQVTVVLNALDDGPGGSVLRNPLPAMAYGYLMQHMSKSSGKNKILDGIETAMSNAKERFRLISKDRAGAANTASTPAGVEMDDMPGTRLFYVLEGTYLSCFPSHEGKEAVWRLNLIDSMVTVNPDNSSVIEIDLPVGGDGETMVKGGIPTGKDKDKDKDRRVVLSSIKQETAEKWHALLLQAARHKISNYYANGKFLGRGAYGEVHLGKYKPDGSLCAVKIIRKSKDPGEEVFLAREIAVLRRVNHPHVVRTYDVFETSRTLYVTMELLAGGDLYEIVSKMGGKMSEEKAGSVFKQLMEGIKYLHEQGIVHRDLKPENLLCKNKDWPLDVKIADFGLCNMFSAPSLERNTSRALDAIALEKMGKLDTAQLSGNDDLLFEAMDTEDDSQQPIKLDHKKSMGNNPAMYRLFDSMVGTPLFVAPEVIVGSYGPGVDVWSSGVILYNILTGIFPFDADTSKEVLHKIRDKPVPFPASVFSRISAEAKDLLTRMLCKDPRKRISVEDILKHAWLTEVAPVTRTAIGNDLSTLSKANRKHIITGQNAADLAGALDHLRLVNELK
ncbi:Serine/threonine-protein kinase GIN4 [Porphyridium purpureum]|uniref:Serine/threonine-protein kinase GIN4 n=1 Tax=Porphyridium purpureum TaxID=35688 RepID=A0A5J4Z4V6_PORPP|nr:Serine/threonine-protein kinase GIN4 [Porphyridium purpureum]|eukprot:POR4370..scf295_1